MAKKKRSRLKSSHKHQGCAATGRHSAPWTDFESRPRATVLISQGKLRLTNPIGSIKLGQGDLKVSPLWKNSVPEQWSVIAGRKT